MEDGSEPRPLFIMVKSAMSRDLRWRIIVLQAILVVVLAFVAGVADRAADFTHSYVHDCHRRGFAAHTSLSLEAEQLCGRPTQDCLALGVAEPWRSEDVVHRG
jgi:hypothetical protein